MQPLSLLAYVGLVVGLFLKLVCLTTFQGVIRIRSRTFHWPEDAAYWGRGSGRVGDDDRVLRAQAALRNDGENHPLMLALSATWVALGAPGALACASFALYVVARVAHGVLLVRPRQPLRNRVYSLGQATTLFVAIDLVRRALGST